MNKLQVLESSAGQETLPNSGSQHQNNIDSIALRGSANAAQEERETQFISLGFLFPSIFMLWLNVWAGIVNYITLPEHEGTD